MSEKSFKEQRIRKIIQLYYSRQDVQKNIFEFSKNREVVPRYFEGFGKRPDSFQYKNDIFELVKRGATSFHCSEELWEDPLKIQTGMVSTQLNELRTGWDLLIDIDCKWFDYAKFAAKAIIATFEQHGIKNIGLKFSGSKGFHILVPWKAFPKEINGIKTKNMFPDIPRKLVAYLLFHSRKNMKELLPPDFYKQFENVKIKRGYKCKKCHAIATETKEVEFNCSFCQISEIKKFSKEEIPSEIKCYRCKREIIPKLVKTTLTCEKCHQWREGFEEFEEIDLFELMGLDIILVSPRHLFRMPYSLHEKTALASIVLEKEELDNFQLKDANPLNVKVKNFMPNSYDEEAKEFVIQALDWYKENNYESEESATGKYADYKPITLKNINDSQFPPCVQNILKGISEGRKRALFILINLFRSIGMNQDELEKKIYEWNEKNEVPLKKGYIISQLSWAYRKKPILPQNCKEFYQGIGICQPDNLCKLIKNPVNYVVRKNFQSNKPKRKK